MPTKRAVTGALAVVLLITIIFGAVVMAEDSIPQSNKAVVQASFDRWRSGTGGPFELLTPVLKSWATPAASWPKASIRCA